MKRNRFPWRFLLTAAVVVAVFGVGLYMQHDDNATQVKTAAVQQSSSSATTETSPHCAKPATASAVDNAWSTARKKSTSPKSCTALMTLWSS